MFTGWNTSDFLQATQIIISIIEILITAFVAIWIVQSIQTKIDNEKLLKEYFSKELIQLRSDIRLYFDKLITGGFYAQSVKREHHLLRVRINDLLSALSKKFTVDYKCLDCYRLNLLKIIEEDKLYNQKYAINGKVKLTDETVAKLHVLRTENDHIFNDILIKIHEAK